MTRAEAEERCRQLAAEDPDRESHHWLAQEVAGGDWKVLKVPGRARGPLSETVAAEERPPHPADPRSGPLRDAPPYGGA